MKRLLTVLAALLTLACASAHAQVASRGVYFYNVPSTVLTRASNTTQYTANTAVCLYASITVCSPITIPLGEQYAGILSGELQHATLIKSGSATTSAAFNIWFYSAAPTTTGLYDDGAYVGPFAADLPNYIGEATCSTANATNDGTAKVWYECALSNPNTAGALPFQTSAASPNNINALIEVTGTYTPASAETFQLYVSGFY